MRRKQSGSVLHGRMYKTDSACPDTTTNISELLDTHIHEVRLFQHYVLNTPENLSSPYAHNTRISRAM
jgi:hypothetical protein